MTTKNIIALISIVLFATVFMCFYFDKPQYVAGAAVVFMGLSMCYIGLTVIMT